MIEFIRTRKVKTDGLMLHDKTEYRWIVRTSHRGATTTTWGYWKQNGRFDLNEALAKPSVTPLFMVKYVIQRNTAINKNSDIEIEVLVDINSAAHGVLHNGVHKTLAAYFDIEKLLPETQRALADDLQSKQVATGLKGIYKQYLSK